MPVFMVVILLAGVAGLPRILVGRHIVERVLALQLLGTCLVAVLLLGSEAWDEPALVLAAALLALLSAIAIIALVRRKDAELFE